MTLDIGDAIVDGLGRAATRSGAVLTLAVFAVLAAILGATNTLDVRGRSAGSASGSTGSFTLPVSETGAAVVGVASLLLLFLGLVVIARALSQPRDELSTLPPSLVTRRAGRATLSAIGVSFLSLIAIVIGLLLLVIPGLFLAVSLLFVIFAVGVEDRRTVDAMLRSSALARGERWHLFGLLLIVTVANVVVGAIGSMLTLFHPLIGEGVDAVTIVAETGILAEAYLQLREDGGCERETATHGPAVPSDPPGYQNP